MQTQSRFTLLSGLMLWPLIALAPFAAQAQTNDDTELAATSRLTAITLPRGGVRMKQVPDTMKDALTQIVKAGGPKVRQGSSEVLAWPKPGYNKARAAQLLAGIKAALEKSRWQVETQKEDGGLFMLTALQTQPTRRAVMGLWVPDDEIGVLAWTEMLPTNAPPEASTDNPVLDNTAADNAVNDDGAKDEPAQPEPVAAQSAPSAGVITLDVDAQTTDVNVMKNAMPRIPTFPKLAVKPGFVRGYVKDTLGKPLKNARIGVRSSAIGGAYSGAQAKTDEKGYYEIAVPFGAAEFYNAGYTIDYGEGRAALGLHPADGELDSFASNKGVVENFVLLPYGIANRDDVQDNPRYMNNYYGGSLTLSCQVSDDGTDPTALPPNSQVDITLTPITRLIDGSKGKTIVIHKHMPTFTGQLYIVNIPIATYRLDVKEAGGGSLKMKETGPNGGSAFGINPKTATGTATFQVRPDSAKADMAGVGHGNWAFVSLSVSR